LPIIRPPSCTSSSPGTGSYAKPEALPSDNQSIAASAGCLLCAGITNTMGGIAIDAGGRVLRNDGSAIDGLYAAGGTTGGLEGGGDRVGYVGGLIKACVFGLRAAEHAAHRKNFGL
jgi:predicted oxidoreductase